MRVKCATVIVVFLGLVATSPAVKADGDEGLEVSTNGECDWTDPGCKNWDSISCTCHDSNYVFESFLRDNTPNQEMNNPSNCMSGGGNNGGHCPRNHRCQDRWNPHTCKCEGKWCENHDPGCKDWNWGHCKCNHNQCPRNHRCQDRWNPHTCKCEGKWCGNHDPRCNNWNWKTCSCSYRELV